MPVVDGDGQHDQNLFLDLLSYLEPILCGVVLVMLLRSKAAKKFVFLVALLSVKILSSLHLLAIALLLRSRH